MDDDLVSRLAHAFGKNLRGAKRTFDRKIGKTEHPLILPYRGFGNMTAALVMGRALRDPGLTAAEISDSWARNLLNSYKRMETDELAGARIRAAYGALNQELVADNEGFFRATVALSTPPPPDAGYWHEIRLELIDPVVEAGAPVANALTLFPPGDAEFGIISDLDDTVIQTGATNILRMVQATLLRNARTRIPFPGVAAFYAALQQGATGTGFNPIFYVSSSPWNLYDVLEQFLALQNIPMGPTLLRDWGLSLERIPFGHAAHKLTSIRTVLTTYPHMRFILMGDSGQEDPEIYREVTREFPGRILCVYIRDVTIGKPRAATLALVGREIEEAGSSMVVAADTITAARHAAAARWIAEDALRSIAEEATAIARLD